MLKSRKVRQGGHLGKAGVHTLPPRRAKSCCVGTLLLLARGGSADGTNVHLVARGARGGVASRGTGPDVVPKRGYAA